MVAGKAKPEAERNDPEAKVGRSGDSAERRKIDRKILDGGFLPKAATAGGLRLLWCVERAGCPEGWRRWILAGHRWRTEITSKS